MIAYSLIGSVSLADWSLYAWRPNTLGADCRCLRHCHGDDLGRNAMGSLSPRLPVPAWSAVVRSGRMAVLLSARLLLVVVLLRRLCTRDFHGRRGHCHVRRYFCHRDRKSTRLNSSH